MVREGFVKLMEIWARIIDRLNANECKLKDYGTGDLLSSSEIHLLQAIGNNPGIKVTGLANHMGVTKGAVSQMVKKLEAKGLVAKYSGAGNEKEVLLKLTASGKTAKKAHDRQHQAFIEQAERSLGDLTEDQFKLLEKFLRTIEKCADDYNQKTS